MMLPLLFLALLGAQSSPAPAQAPPGKVETVPAKVPPAQGDPKPLQSFSFASASHSFVWDKLIPVTLEVDGLQVKTIFFNEREPTTRILQGRKYGHRAQVEVKNNSSKPRTPGFAVAVLDEEGRLLGVASGGTKFGSVKAGETETFDLNFFQVKQRLPRGAKFLLSMELRD